MALDAQYHGDRAVNNDYIDPGEMIFKRRWGVRYSNMITQTIVDYRRAIDYLSTRSEIDAERIGIVGYSMGGHMSFILAANEPRIKTVVSCVVPNTKGMIIEASTFTSEMGHIPLMLMMAKEDTFYSVDDAKRLFDSVQGKNKTLRLYDSGHSLPTAYTKEVVEWVEQQL